MGKEKGTLGKRKKPGQGSVAALCGLGMFFVMAGIVYAGYVLLQNWTLRQDQFLAAERIAPLPLPTHPPTATPPFTPTPWSTPTATPTPTPPPRPILIRIPAIGVESPVVSVPLVTDPATGLADWAIERLYRPGRQDLVGHLEGTALLGQPGNTVLGGHNYGIGYSGVFVKLGRLEVGDAVTVVDESGAVLDYQVVRVERIRWWRKTQAELARHLEFLAPTGPERLTLMSCGGANFEPFPERVYVVAEPLR